MRALAAALRRHGAQRSKHFAVAVVGLVAFGGSLGLSIKPSSAATRLRPTAIVFELDTTVSVPERVRSLAKQAIASRIVQLSKRPHGSISIYARQINHTSGTDSSARFHDVIPAVGAMPSDCTFDPDCIATWANAQNAAVLEARAVKKHFSTWSYRVTSNGTTIRGGIAAGADILRSEPGQRWLVLTTDLRPANAGPPTPEVDLDGVHVDVLLACEDAIGTCQSRARTWRTELLAHHAASVSFFPLQQASEVLTR